MICDVEIYEVIVGATRVSNVLAVEINSVSVSARKAVPFNLNLATRAVMSVNALESDLTLDSSKLSLCVRSYGKRKGKRKHKRKHKHERENFAE